MCGISGWLGANGIGDSEAVVRKMSQALRHRGPDGFGHWVDPDCGLVLVHRRLSILELSSAGHQPMVSTCGRYVIVFNGEIYNHLEIRLDLERDGLEHSWKGRSDTETLLYSIRHWGVEGALQACIGMFAFAVWDKQEKTVIVARDRMGEKPLYYTLQNGVFFFSSELSALRAHPSFAAEVDRDALTLLVRQNCISAPYSIYKGVRKLLPGRYLVVSATDDNSLRLSDEKAYWRLDDAVMAGLSSPFEGSDQEALEIVEKQLSESVRSQMIADVPLGAFLSGGIDSSTVVALMQAQSSRPVRTYTIGSERGEYDEASDARKVAAHLGTDHTELYVSAHDALEVIPQLPSIYCEPFADSSQIPTFLVSKLASKHVKVALSGDGGDELFAGYNRYLYARSVWRQARAMPRALRQALSWFLRLLPPDQWDRVFGFARQLSLGKIDMRMPGDKAHKLAGAILEDANAAFYKYLVSDWQHPTSIVVGGEEPPTLLNSEQDTIRTDNFIEWMMAADAKSYLPDDILTKIDRAAMRNSLETRIPLLDHRLVSLAWSLPLSMKIRDGQGKWLLRKILHRYVPEGLVDRPKMGFGVPIHEWLRGPLRDWAEELLDPLRLRTEGYFRPETVREVWEMHLGGRTNEQHKLWNILMFQAWLAKQSEA